MESEDRNYRKANNIHVVVHPTYCLRNNYRTPGNRRFAEPPSVEAFFLSERHPEYVQDLTGTLEEAGADGDAVCVFYESEQGLEHTRSVLEACTDGVEFEAFRTGPDSGYLDRDGLREFKDFYSSIREEEGDGKIVLHGEVRGRCVTHPEKQLPEEVDAVRDQELLRGVQFPRWEDYFNRR